MSSMDEYELFTVKANSITHRVASVKGSCLLRARSRSSGLPLVILLHGWPECWYSWRHQLLALAREGYPVCAPDMRGFGGTDAPAQVGDYTIDKLCLDVIEICNALGYSQFVVVGHDFGSYLAWHLALLYPEMVVAVCGMSVPYLGHSPRHEPLLMRLQRESGLCLPQPPYCASRQEQEKARFHYILHHNLSGAEQEYDSNCEESLYILYSFKPGVRCDAPEVTDKKMFPSSYCVKTESCEVLDAQSAPGFWARLPRPKSLPTFLTEEDFHYIVEQYRQSGFAGGLKWYQAMDANWYQTRHLRNCKVEQPSLFLVGADDREVLRNHGGLNNIRHGMYQICSNLVDFVVLPDTGHWIQQEHQEEVNSSLLKFLHLHAHCGTSRL